ISFLLNLHFSLITRHFSSDSNSPAPPVSSSPSPPDLSPPAPAAAPRGSAPPGSTSAPALPCPCLRRKPPQNPHTPSSGDARAAATHGLPSPPPAPCHAAAP